MTNEEAKEKFKAIIMAEIDRLPYHYDAEVDDDVYDDTSKVDELLQLNKIVSKALEKADKYRWHELYGAMGQWCTRITGHILFHSPPYTKFDNHTLWAKEYNKIGTWASQGCVRLRSGDAKWIYDNCKSSTKVIIYNNSNPGPLGKPVYAKIPLSQNWDPTDPTV